MLTETKHSISFDIDKRTSFYSTCMYYFQNLDSSRFLSFLNEPSNEILFFDLDSLILSYRVPLHKKGPNATGWVRGFYVISKDSIIVTAAFKPIFFLINSKGKLLNKYDYSKTENNTQLNAFIARSFINVPLAINTNKFYGLQNIFDAWNPMKFNKIPSTPIEFEYDIKTNTTKALPTHFPENYWEYGKFPLFYSRVFNNKSFVWSFCYDHYLYEYDFNGKVKKHRAKSKYIDEFTPLSKNLKNHRYFVSTPRYRELIYDKYRKVYYRFAYHGLKISNTDNLQNLFKYPKTFSIITLNSDLQVINEILLPEDTYNISGWFVAPEGLYISEDHIKNPNLDENILKFRLFKLVKDE